MKKLLLVTLFCLLSEIALAKNVHVLFIGNSYVFSHDMPNMIEELSKSDPSSGVKVITKQVTQGGATLTNHWAQKTAIHKIKARHWDYVIFQEQSSWALSQIKYDAAFRVAPKFRNTMTGSVKTPLLFVTWPRKKGSSWYRGKNGSFFKSYDHMKRQIDIKSQNLANLLGASQVKVGDYWDFISQNYPEIELYGSDGSHPSIAGSYLNALLFYKVVSGSKNIKNLKYTPDQLNENSAKLLRRLIGGN